MHTPFTAPHNVNLLFKYLQGVVLVKPCTVNLSLETCRVTFRAVSNFVLLPVQIFKKQSPPSASKTCSPRVQTHPAPYYRNKNIFTEKYMHRKKTAGAFLKILDLLL